MIEIDTFNIIAIECHNMCHELNRLELQLDQIFDLVDKIETCVPFVDVSCDMIGLDAFRCEFDEYVDIDGKTLVLNNCQELRPMISRYMPSEEIFEKINKSIMKV